MIVVPCNRVSSAQALRDEIPNLKLEVLKYGRIKMFIRTDPEVLKKTDLTRSVIAFEHEDGHA